MVWGIDPGTVCGMGSGMVWGIDPGTGSGTGSGKGRGMVGFRGGSGFGRG
jgi:hypothetical protein